MDNNIKKNLYFYKSKLLFTKGIKEEKITKFDDNFYKEMSTTYISCLPVSIHIKYLKPLIFNGKCYDRSLYMFYCFDNAILLRGDTKYLEYTYGEYNAGHGWIEIDNYVYDPTLLMKIEKDLYYKIFQPTNIKKCTIEEYCKHGTNKKLFNDIKNTTIDDFLPNGSKRSELITIIPLLEGIMDNSNNNDFKKDLKEWLNIIKYDEKQIYEEINNKLKSKSK